jgi:protein TonB
MFETSVVHAQAAAARGRFGLLTISLIAHSAVIIGAVAVSVASVDFPGKAPDEVANAPIFMPVTMPPPPLGRPDGGAAPAQPKPSTPPPAPRPNEVTAPAEIPDDVPTLAATTPGDALSTSNATGTGTSTEPLGVPWGTKDSIGDLDAPPAVMATPAIEDKVYRIEGDVKAPVLLHRVEPGYPEIMRRNKLTATVIVECVIDKNGRVRDARVVSTNSTPPFNDAVVRALDQWRYKPGSLHGQAVETLLHVTVKFGIN